VGRGCLVRSNPWQHRHGPVALGKHLPNGRPRRFFGPLGVAARRPQDDFVDGLFLGDRQYLFGRAAGPGHCFDGGFDEPGLCDVLGVAGVSGVHPDLLDGEDGYGVVGADVRVEVITGRRRRVDRRRRDQESSHVREMGGDGFGNCGDYLENDVRCRCDRFEHENGQTHRHHSIGTDEFIVTGHTHFAVRVQNSFIGAEGVGETTERRLWEAGVTHWDDFAGEVKGVGETRVNRIESFCERGREALADEDIRFFDRTFPSGERWRLAKSFEDRLCAFDIETTGLDPGRSVVTTVSLHQGGDTRTLVRGDDLTDDTLRAAFDDAGILVSFNGKRFDVPFLEQHFDVDLGLPHLDLMYTCRQLGLSGGLSAVESAMGIERELPDVGGREAVRLWHAHEAGEDGALDRLIRYNQEDAENLTTVLDRAVAELTPAVVED